jgi:hypothetical protein
MPRFLFLVVLGLVVSMSGCSATDDDWSGTPAADDDAADDDAADDDAADDDAGDDDSAPAEIEDPETTLVGGQYLLDYGSGQLTDPAGADGIVMQYIADWYLVLLVDDLDDGAGTITLYLGGSGAVIGTWDNPAFSAGPLDVIDPGSGETVLYQATIDGVFVDAGAAMNDLALDAIYDVRFLDDLIDPEGGVGLGCELLDHEGVPCEACPGSDEPYCVRLVFESMTAQRMLTP